ncbi:sensor domain-containing diguanylate cyclase [Brevibacillus sp. H7]|uniref:sensor domain-containing diguanylate cyclase n=1 Tax=Brevibacillus sp. H7 TaxID=3349138 RepID=UPI00382B9067
MSSKMLGKLETVFSYTAHFLLQSWPENRPGLFFLTDSAGCLVNSNCMQIGQTWTPDGFVFQPGESIVNDHSSPVSLALATGEIVVKEWTGAAVWGAFPLKERDGRIRAVIGLVAPKAEIDFDLASYMKGLEPLIRMGYDAYMQHAIGEIVMNVNRYDRSRDLIQSLITQISEIIDKGFCSAVTLSDKGTLIPQESFTTERCDPSEAHIAQLVARLVDEEVKPSVLDGNRTVIFPISCENKHLYALFLHLPPDETDCVYDERDVAFLQEIGEKASYALMRSMISDELRRDASKKDLLYQLTAKIQASIDVNDVLEEIVKSIGHLYPYFEVDLYLTVETNTTIPIKPLSFQDDESDPSTRAYLEGRLIVDYQEKDGARVAVVAAPLLGKQGIYGVLQLTSNQLVTVSKNETDYISILAETAGTAFENAQLYQQSRNLIRELRLINEMAQQLNSSLNLNEILQFVTKMLLETFAAEYCAILRKLPDSDKLVVISASDPDTVGKTVSSKEAPLADIFKNKQALILAHPSTETMPFSLAPFASLMGVPLLTEAEVTGVLLVSDSRLHFFSFDDYKLLEIFGQHTSLAITNAMLHNEVERMVITDNLTGLYTRRYLNEFVRTSLENDSYGSLILIDIDYFKSVNDTYGHQVGDEVLIQVAELIRRCIRESDIAARWGGEELAVYLPRVDSMTAHAIAERIRAYVEAETAPRVTISCGLAKWTREFCHDMSVEALFHQADVALYEAKNKGRNQVILA